jgi:hypothetical protein
MCPDTYGKHWFEFPDFEQDPKRPTEIRITTG